MGAAPTGRRTGPASCRCRRRFRCCDQKQIGARRSYRRYHHRHRCGQMPPNAGPIGWKKLRLSHSRRSRRLAEEEAGGEGPPGRPPAWSRTRPSFSNLPPRNYVYVYVRLSKDGCRCTIGRKRQIRFPSLPDKMSQTDCALTNRSAKGRLAHSHTTKPRSAALCAGSTVPTRREKAN